jgi:hypothetical protein
MHFVHHQDLEANPVTTTGDAIAKRGARTREDVRAIMGARLLNGTARLSQRQAAKAADVSRHKIKVATLATPDEIERVKRGRLRLSDVRKAHAKARDEMSDADIAGFIDHADPNRVLAVLDAMTAPMAAE